MNTLYQPAQKQSNVGRNSVSMGVHRLSKIKRFKAYTVTKPKIYNFYCVYILLYAILLLICHYLHFILQNIEVYFFIVNDVTRTTLPSVAFIIYILIIICTKYKFDKCYNAITLTFKFKYIPLCAGQSKILTYTISDHTKIAHRQIEQT